MLATLDATMVDSMTYLALAINAMKKSQCRIAPIGKTSGR
jgi:hypothetical protein